MVTLPARRTTVSELHERRGYSERQACSLVSVARSSYRYKPETQREDEGRLRKRIKELACCHKRYGCPRITVMLRREEWVVNKKRVHRIWKEECLQVQRKLRRKRRGPRNEVLNKAEHRDHVWCYDFVEDRTVSGNKVRFLTVVDEYTRECLAIEAGRSMGAKEVIECLEWLFLTRRVPEYIRSDKGPECVAIAVREWLSREGCKTIYIEPGSPWENPYIESFIGKFRDECLNMELFRNAREAQAIADAWREEYNERRPHSSLGNLSPKEFVKVLSASAVPPLASPHLQKVKEINDPLIGVGT
jgi:transposase InsO family protein